MGPWARTWPTLKSARLSALPKALPPLLSYDLNPDEHFAQALARGRDLLPTELPAVLDLDLAFAADCHAYYRGRLRDLRRTAVGALRELHRRWCAVGRHLRQFQPIALTGYHGHSRPRLRCTVDFVDFMA